MAKPTRTFTGQEGQRSTGTAGPDALRHDLDAIFAMFDPHSTLPGGASGGIGAENMKGNASTDDVIGDRTISDTAVPSGDSGKLSTLLGWIANRIKAITGASDWKADPATTLSAAKAHIDAAAPHSGHETPEGAQAKVNAHAAQKNPHGLTAADLGAITGIAGVTNPGGHVDVVGGSAVSITKDPANNRIIINAHTEGAAPGAHANTHASGGSDPITPAMIGAATAGHGHPELPTSSQKAALAGTSGTPSNTNRYVTNSDPRMTDSRTPKPHTHGAGDLPKASTSAQGIVQLVDSSTSTSTTMAPTAKALAEAAVPPGAIMAFARQTPPPGWLACNGQAVSRNTYSNLFAAIGTTFGAGNGVTTFNLPDLRGEFIRGWDNGRGVDPARQFGSSQGDAIRNITATFWNYNFYGATGAIKRLGGNGVGYFGDANNAAQFVFDASEAVPVAHENRPRNVALLYCIKV